MSKLESIFLSLAKLQKIKNRGITASELSEYIGLDRANVSRYLNRLYKENRVDKVVGRPVVYSISSIKDKYENLVVEEENVEEKNSLDKLVGAKLSLEMPIQQAKAAILYPPHGLHTLILGETGVGKSMFAEYMYLFGKESRAISEEASFVRFNCADYADNPQLVIAQIFGVKKGAYTGADRDRIGLLKKADKGVLFLDEIHRLSPQAQEMLFTYIDKGSFRPLGDTETMEYSTARIIAATTEDPGSFMLKTFTRRIPMIITLPALKERTIEERYCLLKQFIKAESNRLKTNIYFNKNVIISFLLYDCPNNIGQLKSDIQLSCAKAFLKYKTKVKDIILVEQEDIHTRVKKGIMKLKDYKSDIEKLLDDKGDLLKFSYKEDESFNIEERDERSSYFYDSIEKKYIELKNKGIEEKYISGILNVDIDKYFKLYIEQLRGQYRKDEISKIVNISLVNKVEEILNLASKKLNKSYDEKVYFGLALHLQGVLERIKKGIKIYNPKLNFIKNQYAKEFYIAMEGAKIIEDTFSLNIPLDEIGYLTMFIAAKSDEDDEKDIRRVKVMVIMHGRSTASSMVEVANTLIGEEFIIPLDMSLNTKAEDMYLIVKDKARKIDEGMGILFLVDMGSLTNFGEMIKEETGIEIKTVDMTSTLVAIEGGRKALSGKTLDEIYKSCLQVSRDSAIEKKLVYNIRKNIIITACFTGEGSAEKLKKIIRKNIKFDIKIISLNILDREDFLRNIDELSKEFNIVAIVGTINISVNNIPFIEATSVLADNGIERLNKLLGYEEDYKKIAKSIDVQIVNIDGIKLVELIRTAILEIEERLELVIPHEVEVGIIIHLCFLIEKTIKGDKGINFEQLNEYRKLHGKEFIMIKQSLRKIEIMYNINIGDNQLAFIVRMLIENSISV
ncbi:MAG: PRD domain-containing protein [Clostridium sp.]|nr:PRD domain-containing protein [Clostridium sp.]